MTPFLARVAMLFKASLHCIGIGSHSALDSRFDLHGGMNTALVTFGLTWHPTPALACFPTHNVAGLRVRFKCALSGDFAIDATHLSSTTKGHVWVGEPGRPSSLHVVPCGIEGQGTSE